LEDWASLEKRRKKEKEPRKRKSDSWSEITVFLGDFEDFEVNTIVKGRPIEKMTPQEPSES
jgi:hypothetical protein